MEFSLDDVKEALREVLEEEIGGGHSRIAPRWTAASLSSNPSTRTSNQRRSVERLFQEDHFGP